MSYESLFDVVNGNANSRINASQQLMQFNHFAKHMAYEGDLLTVLHKLEEDVVSDKNKLTAAMLVLNAARIIRATIDYKINHSENPSLERYVKDAVELGLDIYKSSKNISEKIQLFQKKILESDYHDLLSTRIQQKYDKTSWRACYPDYSKLSVAAMKSELQQKDVLFIALGHGGVIAGMDVYLRYCDAADYQDSVFYPVRFSPYKLKDEQPQIKQSERNAIITLANNRDIVLFDEDTASGETLKKANQFFKENLFPQRRIRVIVNY
ncbi:hypothetical protein HZA96_06475 [Candidatus Woesearchaeota archaeon]|nr:hypothetical protein [Candidatus Woesearchaeota archaeon]